MILGRGGAFALSSPCISLMAIPTATVGIQGEDFLYSIAEQGHGWDCDISILEVNLKQMDTTKVKHESIVQYGVCAFDS